eukprot:TRINITY_DN26365_c0_g1_i1.p1 TRINITY_DN26365_c0_g1~~TRINITY_DN26365_c0_g1_i1.p1  ORF type:complete len:199 (-),score=49.47 TRINITY_DN26365_c0_g1_i1:324-920(-)
MVAAAFNTAAAAAHLPSKGEYAVFLSKVVGDQQAAAEAFEAAVGANPDDADLRYTFGNFCDQEMEDQQRAAGEYDKALQLDPVHCETLNNYAALLVEMARAGADMTLLNQAHLLLLRAEELAPGFPAYNLACIACLMQNEQEVERWLRTAYRSDAFEALPCAGELVQDDDLEGVRRQEWFANLMVEIQAAQEQGNPLP